MKKPIYIFCLFIPQFINGQSSPAVSYAKGLADCQRIVEVNQLMHPGKFIYTGPDCLIGATVPEFSTTTMEGKEISNEYFKGKITVLNFWMISCPPCIAEIPGLNNVVDKFGSDKVNYLAIGTDDEKDIKAFLVKHPWKFTQLAPGMKTVRELFKVHWGFPTTFIINEDAVIVAAFSGGKTDETAVKEIEDKLTGIITKELK